MHEGSYIKNPILDADHVKAELQKEILTGAGIPDWITEKFYKVGQAVIESNCLYISLINHVSTVFAVDFAANYWKDIGTASGPTFLHGEVTNYASLPPAAANPAKRFFVNTTTGIIGLRKLNGIYRSDGANWIYQGYDRHAQSIKDRYESNPDTNVFTDAEKAKLAATKAEATRQAMGGISSVGSSATNKASFGHNDADGGFTCIGSGRITDISITMNNARTAGVCQLQILVNGVAQTAAGETIDIDGVNPINNYISIATPIEFNAGDILSMQTITTMFAPVTADSTLIMVLELDI